MCTPVMSRLRLVTPGIGSKSGSKGIQRDSSPTGEKADCSREIGYFPYLYVALEIRELYNGKFHIPWQYRPPPESQNVCVNLSFSFFLFFFKTN